MYTLLVKEINAFLSSLIGYIVVTVFLLINGLLLWIIPMGILEFNILDYGYAGIDGFFMLAPWVFLLLIPAITMRSFSDEKRSGTIESLMTRPITDLKIVLAKYFAGFILVLIALVPTLIYFITVYWLGLPPGNIDLGGTWGSYIGLLFLAATFVAIGLFCSSITDNQILSFIIAFLLCFFFYSGFELFRFGWFGSFDYFLQQLGINAHYVSMSRGVLDTRDLIYFLSLISFFILLTKVSLEKRKW